MRMLLTLCVHVLEGHGKMGTFPSIKHEWKNFYYDISLVTICQVSRGKYFTTCGCAKKTLSLLQKCRRKIQKMYVQIILLTQNGSDLINVLLYTVVLFVYLNCMTYYCSYSD